MMLALAYACGLWLGCAVGLAIGWSRGRRSWPADRWFGGPLPRRVPFGLERK